MNMIIVAILALRFLIKLRFPANTPISIIECLVLFLNILKSVSDLPSLSPPHAIFDSEPVIFKPPQSQTDANSKKKTKRFQVFPSFLRNHKNTLKKETHKAYLRNLSWHRKIFLGITEKPDPGPVGPDPNGPDPGRISIHLHVSR